jgi:hypothetical protein
LVASVGGCVQRKKGRYAWANKNVVLTLVERGGAARSFHIDGVRAGEILPIIRENLSREARLMTDEMSSYKVIAEIEEIAHETVNHFKDEYVRGDVTTNTVEGYLLDLQARHGGRLSALR